jgi:phosphatidylglycerophosphate synthase
MKSSTGSEVGDRRPIPARSTGWARRVAGLLARAGITPNQVSLFGLLVMAVCAACLIFSSETSGTTRILLLLLAAATIVIRAGCNMFDGMVAVEFGQARKSGAVFNEFPDRLSDGLMLVGAGYAATGVFSSNEITATLGWAAAVGAILTAYVRALGGSLGVPQDFSGVMAKQQRMAVLVIALVGSTFEGLWSGNGELIAAGLVLVIIGCVITVVQRTARLISTLEAP